MFPHSILSQKLSCRAFTFPSNGFHTGEEYVLEFNSITFSLHCDKNGSIEVFTTNFNNNAYTSQYKFDFVANIELCKTISVNGRLCKFHITNDDGTEGLITVQSILKYNNHIPLNPFNNNSKIDDISVLTRPVSTLNIDSLFGTSHIQNLHIQGIKDSIQTGRLDVISPKNGNIIGLTPNQALEIISTSIHDDVNGLAAKKVKIHGLQLDGGLYKEKTETVNMNGTSTRSLIHTYAHVNKIEVIESGSYRNNQGDITLRLLGGSDYHNFIKTGDCESKIAWYQLPYNKDYLIEKLHISSYSQHVAEIIVRIFSNNSTKNTIKIYTRFNVYDTDITIPMNLRLKGSEGEAIQILVQETETITTNSINTFKCDLHGYLIDNTKYIL